MPPPALLTARGGMRGPLPWTTGITAIYAAKGVIFTRRSGGQYSTPIDSPAASRRCHRCEATPAVAFETRARHQLARLHPAELGEGAVRRLIPPDALRLGEHRVATIALLVITVVLGLLGGLVIGGWVFLSNGYALGGESLRYSWAFDTKFWYFFPYNTEMNETTSAWLSGTAAKTGTWFTPHFWAYAYGAAGTALVTVLRQLFAGFWFHPIGFILASTGCLSYIWGSALTAWVIRRVVLWMGGAATIRNKLQPFFVGVLLGAVVAELLLCAHAQQLHSLGIERFFGVLSPP